jgi:outer membrane autotransporter protein
MMGLGTHTRTNGRLNKTHLAPTLTVAPVTRAIRAALTLLALGGSGAAIAQGTCTFTAPTTVSCDGVFTNTVPGTFFTPVADLTLVLGDTAPTSVTPATGLMGIDANWGGSVGVTSSADITTQGADGIFADSATTATVNNQGSITTNVTAANAKAIDVTANGDVSVVNNGPVNAYSAGVYDVTAVNAYSVNGDATVDNQALGTITATAQDGNALAVNASAYTAATITNEGAITASSVYGTAVGVTALAYNGLASITNSGSITATSTNYEAVGIIASSSNGYALATNNGSVTATGGQDQAIGIEATSALGSTVVNNGYVTATSFSGAAIGVLAQTTNGDATVTNSGSITSTTNSVYQSAIGAEASSTNGQATVNNSGHISAINHNGLGIGIEAYSALGSTINNSGYVVSGSYQSNTIGALAKTSSGNASITNSATGYIRTIALQGTNGYATGAFANAVNGIASVTNAGTIYAASNGAATGIQVLASGANGGGDVYVNNSGKVEASGSYLSDERGIQAFSTTGSATVVNSGTVVSGSSQHEGSVLTTVDGIRAYGYSGSTVTNSGRVYASGPWFTNGMTGIVYNGAVSVTNTATGTIEALGLVPTGINAVNYYGGQAVANNAGSIVVFQDEKCFCDPGQVIVGTGIFAYSEHGTGVAVTNSGSISINSLYGAYGIHAVAKDGNVSVENSGSIAIATNGYGSVSWGINAVSDYGSVSIVNSGDISIVEGLVPNTLLPQDDVRGIYAMTDGKAGNASSLSDLSIVNTGNISLTAFRGYGIVAKSFQGSVSISNAGHITVNNGFDGGGIVADSYAGGSVAGNVTVDNSGSIAITSPPSATGVATVVSSTGATYITNSGDIVDASELDTIGVFARNVNFAYGNNVTIENSGLISSITSVDDLAPVDHAGYAGHSVGVHVYTYGGVITVGNSGSIVAQTTADDQLPGTATGVLVHNGYGNYFGDVGITNTGSITASLTSSNSLPGVGQLGFYGPLETAATGILLIGTYGDVAVTNSGSISATAQSDHYAGGGAGNGVTTASGISVISTLGTGVARSLSLGNITVTNSPTGSITALASSSYGHGDTARASGISALVSVGSYGASLVSAGRGITINNAGSVSATALIANDATGIATASGISAINGSAAGFANVINNGLIDATATTTGAATATGIVASGNTVTATLNSGGTINATATGASGTASGLSLTNTGTGALTSNNAGVLMATFNGAGKAYGAMITSAGDVAFTNTGHILASNATSAVGVAFDSPTNVMFTNSGTITANSAAAASVAVLSTGTSNAILNNSGTINGAIQTGAGNDSLTNAVGGVWNAVGASDFGAGDDTVTNAGRINLNSTTISLGSDPAGNQFGNTGLINVLGSNTITMVTGTAVNPYPFTNSGTINFQNGAANNTLTIVGNFAGNGQIDMDVNGANRTGDLLKIQGNVVAGSVSTVNVNLLSDPTTASTTIPLVQVSGTSAAGSFVLGQFIQPKGFLGLSESLLNTPNTLSLGLTVAATSTPPAAPPPSGTVVVVTVDGLSQLGTLAASAAPGVQSLMRSQIGTLEDRMGAVSQTIKGGFSVWTRAFGDSGTVDPGHSAGNFGQNGNFGFDQSNSGEELGLDFAISDEFKAGALFDKSQANQSLDGNEADSSKINSDTSGIYGTWIAPSGFYVDASYRWMTFNDRLHAPAGFASIRGNADAFNLEAGKTWTLQNGLQIAPQFQYTLTKVDNINAQAGSLAGFQSTGDDDSRARLGVMFSKEYTPASGRAVWMPYASLSAVQELDGKNSYSVNDAFFGETNTKGTSALAETGVNVQLGKLALYGGLNWQDGGALKSFFGGQVGLRYTF